MDSIKGEEVDYSVFSEAEDAPFIAFLRRMLTKDQEKRATITDLLDDPYLTDNGKHLPDLFYNESVSSDSVSELMSVVASVEEISNQSTTKLSNGDNVLPPHMRLDNVMPPPHMRAFGSAPSNLKPHFCR